MFNNKRIKTSGNPSYEFNEATFERIAKDLKSRRIPLLRQQISDDSQVHGVTGLRVMINRSGLISYHVSYYVNESRPFMKIGEANKDSPHYISLQEARNLTRTIVALGERGIDPQDGLMKRLIFELKRDGVDWRPEGTKDAELKQEYRKRHPRLDKPK